MWFPTADIRALLGKAPVEELKQRGASKADYTYSDSTGSVAE